MLMDGKFVRPADASRELDWGGTKFRELTANNLHFPLPGRSCQNDVGGEGQSSQFLHSSRRCERQSTNPFPLLLTKHTMHEALVTASGEAGG